MDGLVEPALKDVVKHEAPCSANTARVKVARAKRSFVCRHVRFSDIAGLSTAHAPRSGDLVLATVTELGHHRRLETPAGRRAELYIGDEILVAYGARYAPDQFEAIIPSEVAPCELVAGGGIAAQVVARHSAVKAATRINPIGLLTDVSGHVINLRRFAAPQVLEARPACQVVGIVGTSMNAGKTTVAANLINGLSSGGLRVGACKITGTGSGGDLWAMLDAGAAAAFDFTDEGFATTAGADLEELERAAHGLIERLEAHNVDIIVAEIADGLLQRETAALLSSDSFAKRLDVILLAAADSMGALTGANWLRERGLPLCAVTGLLTSSPLAIKEARANLGVEVVQTKALLESTLAERLSLQSRVRRPFSVVT